jgi:hypothetical protein
MFFFTLPLDFVHAAGRDGGPSNGPPFSGIC